MDTEDIFSILETFECSLRFQFLFGFNLSYLKNSNVQSVNIRLVIRVTLLLILKLYIKAKNFNVLNVSIRQLREEDLLFIRKMYIWEKIPTSRGEKRGTQIATLASCMASYKRSLKRHKQSEHESNKACIYQDLFTVEQ